MNYKSLGSISLSFLLLFGMFSCGPNNTEEKQESSDEFEQAETDLKDQIQEVIYEIPSPSEIPSLLERTGAEYNEAMVNDEAKADQYLTKNEQAALNLGVYASDIGYLISYDKVQEALTYMNAAKKLADNLGITGSFNAGLINRFEENISNKDSLNALLNETLAETDDYLKDNDRNKMAAMVIAGSFVEGLYISTALIDTYPKDLLPEDKRILILTPLMRVVADQKNSLSEVIKMLETVEKSSTTDELITKLKDLKKDYETLNIDEQIKNNRADLVLSDESLNNITTKTAEIRASIVN